jgi:hypothetical protein
MVENPEAIDHANPGRLTTTMLITYPEEMHSDFQSFIPG